MTVAGAFDSIAPRYDALWDHSVTGRLQRDALWSEIGGLFRAGDRVLDLGCGTGTDAVRLAACGVRVHACDISPAMVAAARRRARLAGLSESITCAVRDAAAPVREAPYDGAISNFGVVNCIADLSAFARAAALSIRPGGHVAICTMGPFCPWEVAWHLLHGRARTAFRRFRGPAASSMGFPVYYHSPRAIRAAFAESFRVLREAGIGILVPPSCGEQAARGAPGLFRLLFPLERAIARWPLARSLADHRLFIFRRFR